MLKKLSLVPVVVVVVCVLLMVVCPRITKYLSSDEFTPEAPVLFAKACDINGGSCIPNVLLIRGAISKNTVSALERLLEKRGIAGFTTVCFDSVGGNVDEAVDIGDWIFRHKLNTCYAEKYIFRNGESRDNIKCNSACTFILLMGRERMLVGNKAHLIIHHSGRILDFCFCQPKFNDNLPYSSTHQYERMVKVGRDSDEAHQAFIDLSLKTHFSDRYRVTPDEYLKYSIFTNI